MARFIYHAPEHCPCRKRHLAANPPSKKASREQREAWTAEVCGACGSSLFCPVLQLGCAFCLPEGLIQEVEPGSN